MIERPGPYRTFLVVGALLGAWSWWGVRRLLMSCSSSLSLKRTWQCSQFTATTVAWFSWPSSEDNADTDLPKPTERQRNPQETLTEAAETWATLHEDSAAATWGGSELQVSSAEGQETSPSCCLVSCCRRPSVPYNHRHKDYSQTSSTENTTILFWIEKAFSVDGRWKKCLIYSSPLKKKKASFNLGLTILVFELDLV